MKFIVDGIYKKILFLVIQDGSWSNKYISNTKPSLDGWMLSESFVPENLKSDATAVDVLNMSVKIVLMSLCGWLSLTSFYSYFRWRWRKWSQRYCSFCFFKLHLEMVLLHIMIFLSLKISLYRNYANFKFVNDMKFSLQKYLKGNWS